MLSDVGFKAKAAGVMGAYHPFWARLAMETIVGRSTAGAAMHVLPLQLTSFKLHTVVRSCRKSDVLG